VVVEQSTTISPRGVATASSGQAQLTAEQAGLLVVDRDTYTDAALTRRVFEVLRKEDPIHYVDHPLFPPLWAITRRDDVAECLKQTNVFVLGRSCSLLSRIEARAMASPKAFRARHLLVTNADEHAGLRKLTQGWFTSKACAKLNEDVVSLARDAVDKMQATETCDFAGDIACFYPLQVILAMLGLPESDYDLMLRLSGGSGDRELQTGGLTEEEVAATLAVQRTYREYFNKLTADRKANPTDDLASVIANGVLPDGTELGEAERNGYYTIITGAGHETTTASLAGGMFAFIQNPDQLARLKADPTLMPKAVDEIIRWSTPAYSFTRIVVQRYKLGDVWLEPGDLVLLCYKGANFDESVFENPYTFDVARSPNPHLGFGAGAHYCLGHQLARLEVSAFLNEFLPRIERVELAGEPRLRRNVTAGGFAKLPIRCTWNS
jgi:cytochrome P450